MAAWFAENAGTIFTALVLAVILFFVLRKIVADIRAGRSACGCGGSCASCGVCRRHSHGDAAKKNGVRNVPGIQK